MASRTQRTMYNPHNVDWSTRYLDPFFFFSVHMNSLVSISGSAYPLGLSRQAPHSRNVPLSSEWTFSPPQNILGHGSMIHPELSRCSDLNAAGLPAFLVHLPPLTLYPGEPLIPNCSGCSASTASIASIASTASIGRYTPISHVIHGPGSSQSSGIPQF